MKKKIIICVFWVLILVTAIVTGVCAVESYNYDIENNIDIFEGFGVVLTIVVGAFVVLYEFDLFNTVYYFFIKPKTVAKTVLNILSNFSLVLIFAYSYLSDYSMELRRLEIIPYILFAVYVVLRLFYLIIPELKASKEDDRFYR